MNVSFKDLNISRDEALDAFLVLAPWDPNLYISRIGDILIGIGDRHDLTNALERVREDFSEGIIEDYNLEVREKPTVKGDIVRSGKELRISPIIPKAKTPRTQTPHPRIPKAKVPKPLGRIEKERRKNRWLQVANPDWEGAQGQETYKKLNEWPTYSFLKGAKLEEPILVTCKGCGKIFDYGKEPEIAMGAIKCPNCGATIDQEGTVRSKTTNANLKKEDSMIKNVEWMKKVANVVSSSEKGVDANSSTFKTEGPKGDIQLNPKPNAFEPTKESAKAHDCANSPEFKSPGEKIKEAEMKPYSKSAYLSKSAGEVPITEGTKEKLEYPRPGSAFPSVTTPGVVTEKIDIPITEGTKEPLDYKPGEMKVTEGEPQVTTDEAIGKQFKDSGEKEKLMTKPANDTFTPAKPSQEKVTGLANKYKDAGEVAKSQQKQFSQVKWMKREAASTPPSMPVEPGADSKEYKDPGQKEKLIFNPAQNAFEVDKPSQLKDETVLKGRKETGEVAKPQQKQFSQVEWIKKTS